MSDNFTPPYVVTDVAGYLAAVLDFDKTTRQVVTYRGHEDESYRLQPSVARTPKFLANENILLNEILSIHPIEFGGDNSTLEQLVRAQHYSIPTRLLDVSFNPLVALYFACQPKKKRRFRVRRKGLLLGPLPPAEEANGQVVSFIVEKDVVKYFDSDRVAILANLAKLPRLLRDLINFSLLGRRFYTQLPIKRLLHLIRQEKSGFLADIIPDDLLKTTFVKPKLNNRRIIAQTGAFLLFGIEDEMPVDGTLDIKVRRITIDADRKKSILLDLDKISVNERTLFPEVDRAANYIKTYL